MKDLSPRQQQILSMLPTGMSNKLIARELGIDHRTVKVHLEHIYARLGVANRVQAAMIAAGHRQ